LIIDLYELPGCRRPSAARSFCAANAALFFFTDEQDEYFGFFTPQY
jgi:hypothetical protein